MSQKVVASPIFRYKYLVLALATCISLATKAETHHPALTANNNNIEKSQFQKTKTAKALSPLAGRRMGEWLTQEFGSQQQDYYESALVWQSNNEIAQQQSEYEILSQRLEDFSDNKGNSDILPLQRWLTTLPATGRVVLSKQDPRYLQANPHIEPVFATNDTVIIHQHPTTMTVLFDDAQACKIVYEAGVRAKDYIDGCLKHINKNLQADGAYLISPDGTVQYLTLAKWNAQQQSTPSLGSWLWVPNPKHGWPDELALAFAHFLATQGIDLTLPQGQSEVPIHLTTMHPDNARDLPVGYSDWGITGLMQTPTARMQDQGTLGVHISNVEPYTQYNLILQPFEWLETAVRYTNIEGVPYGSISPNQDLKDKSLDVKLKLLKEDRLLPEVAVGWRDPAGTSLFGGEYVVANKRYGDFDFSLGMGWGYLGARKNIKNPLGSLSDHFENRVADKAGQGGELSPKSWFTGPGSLFGGVQWHTPYDPLTIKVEYDGNDYQSEPHSKKNYNPEDVPINIGATWQNKDRGIALSAGLERGDTLMLGLTMEGDLSELGQVKPKAEQVQYLDSMPSREYSSFTYRIDLGGNESSLSKNEPLLNAFSQATGWQATDLSITEGHVLLNVEKYSGVFISERLQQGMKILQKALPANTKTIQIQVSEYGEAVGVFNINPKTWAQQYQQLLPPSQRIQRPVDIIAATQNDVEIPASQVLAHTELPKGALTFFPSYHQSFGGPDGYIYGLFANANANYKLWTGSWVNAHAQLRLASNYDQFNYTAPSKLPRVRTHIREYMTTSDILMPNLQWSQFKPLSKDWYGLVYAGYLDPMFAGVGGEILYRKPNQPWAIGLDINRVRKRDFDQHFGLKDYEATTGHVSLYWDTPIYDIDLGLSAGQYLAGDKGATLELSRRFDNGVKMGGWLTKTDVSSEEFGEGSMDKGIYVSIPFDTFFKQWSSGYTNIVYQPLIRDGGAKLSRKYTLFGLTSSLDESLLEIKNPLE